MMSYHFGKMDIVSATWIPVFYALAMGSSGLGSLVFGRLFDRKGLVILIPLTVVTSLFAPLAFLGGFWVVLVGCALWGVGERDHNADHYVQLVAMLPVTRATRCQTRGSPASTAGQCAHRREKRSSLPLAWRVRRR